MDMKVSEVWSIAKKNPIKNTCTSKSVNFSNFILNNNRAHSYPLYTLNKKINQRCMDTLSYQTGHVLQLL